RVDSPILSNSTTLSSPSTKTSLCSNPSVGQARIISSSGSGASAQYVLQTTNSGNNESQGAGRVIIATAHAPSSQSSTTTTTTATHNTNSQGQAPYVAENRGQFTQQNQNSNTTDGTPV
ncbi:unnamed protein product, partial [Didymodactylos carnosus]